jgi:hypothetical protein
LLAFFHHPKALYTRNVNDKSRLTCSYADRLRKGCRERKSRATVRQVCRGKERAEEREKTKMDKQLS